MPSALNLGFAAGLSAFGSMSFIICIDLMSNIERFGWLEAKPCPDFESATAPLPPPLLPPPMLRIVPTGLRDRKSTRLNSSHGHNSHAVFCLKKKNPQPAGPVAGPPPTHQPPRFPPQHPP